MRIVLIFFLAAFINLQITAAQCSRQLVINKYRSIYLTSQVTGDELKWTGESASCVAGAIAPSAATKTLNLINYFRDLCGLPNPVEWDTAYNRKAQDAALMIRANSDLSHDPPASWKCYSESGKEAAGKSNLALGYHSTQAIIAYMADHGESNYAVGHRRWILYPRARYFGQGSTSSSQALWVIGRTGTDPKPSFVAYPAPGFFPKPLVYPRWSFSKDRADFSQAEVTMWDGAGNQLLVRILSVANGFGSNTLVWEPVLPAHWLSDPMDRKIKVVVDKVITSGIEERFAYEVDLIPLLDRANCEPGYVNDGCSCIADITTSLATNKARLQPRLRTNPVQDALYVEDISGPTSAEVRNLAGQLVWSGTILQDNKAIPLEAPAGMYYLLLHTRPHRHQLAFIKL